MELFQLTKTFHNIYDKEGLEASRLYYEDIMKKLPLREYLLVKDHFKTYDLDYTGMFSRLRYTEVYLGYTLGIGRAV